MPDREDSRNFIATLLCQLRKEESLVEAHLDALERGMAKIANPEATSAKLMREAIIMKRRRLESLRRQIKRLEGVSISDAGPVL